jgi:hypothetical protein
MPQVKGIKVQIFKSKYRIGRSILKGVFALLFDLIMEIIKHERVILLGRGQG